MRLLVLSLLLIMSLSVKAQWTIVQNETTCRTEVQDIYGNIEVSFETAYLRWKNVSKYIINMWDDDNAFQANVNTEIDNYLDQPDLEDSIKTWIEACPVGGGGGSPIDRTFVNRTSLQLDGVDQYVLFGDVDDFDFGTDPFTITFFVKGYTEGSALIAKDDWGSFNNGLLINQAGGSVNYVSNGSLKTIGATTDDKWHQVAISRTSTAPDSTYMYFDGVLTNTTTEARDFSNSKPFVIGCASNQTNHYSGFIDNVVIWNTALTTQEIKEVTALRAYKYHSKVDNVISAWAFDFPDDGASVINDLASGGNNGVPVNTTSDNLVACIDWPYPYQLNPPDKTPLQDSQGQAFSGYAWDLNGTNEFINFGAASIFNISISIPMTFNVWVNPNGVTSGEQIFGKTKAIPDDSYGLLVYDNNTLRWTMRKTSANRCVVASNYPIPANKWTMITISTPSNSDGANTRMYINGVESGTTLANSLTTELTYGAINFAVGSIGSGGDYFDGKIDGLSYWRGRELTAEEIWDLYKNHAPKYPPTELSDMLTGYWNGFHSDAASFVYDQVGSSDGTCVNMGNTSIPYQAPRAIFDADSVGSISFNAVNEVINFDDAVAVSSGDTEGTWSIWANPKVRTTSSLMSFGQTNGSGICMIYTASGGGIIAFFANSGGNLWQVRTTSLSLPVTGVWSNITLVQDGVSPKMYVNGMEVGLDILIGTDLTAWMVDAPNLDNARFGARNYSSGGNSLFYNGLLSMPSTFDRALTACDVLELYNDGSPLDLREATFQDNLTGLWRFNQADDVTTSEGILDIINGANATGVNMDAGNTDKDNYPTN